MFYPHISFTSVIKFDKNVYFCNYFYSITNKNTIYGMLTLDLIYKASTMLKDVVRRTQLIPTQKINPSANVFLKP